MKFICKRPWAVVAVIAVITVFFALQLPKSTLDNDITRFLPEDHPSRLAFNRVSDIFGGQLAFVVAIESPYGKIITPENIGLIRDLEEKLSALDIVEDVTCLTNTDFIDGTEEGMEVVPIIPEDFSGASGEIDEIVMRLTDWDMYRKVLVSDDMKSTLIVIRTEKDSFAKQEALYDQVTEILRAVDRPDLNIYLAGEPAVTVRISKNMRTDLAFLIPLVVIILCLSLYFSFRRLSGIVLPLLTVAISTIWTMGLIALLGFSLSIIATTIPVLMVAVGSAYGIHVLTHYLEGLDDAGEGLTPEANEALVRGTIKSVWQPVFLAGLTTIAGFGSLAMSQIVPLRDFGIFTAFGVLSALIVALTLIPALLIIKRGRLKRIGLSGEGNGSRGRTAELFYNSVIRHKISVVGITVLIVLFAALGARKVVVDNVMIEYFKPETDLVKADTFINGNFAGTSSFTVLVQGEKKGDMLNPEILRAMDGLGTYLKDAYPAIRKTLSYSDFIKRMNQVMNFPGEGGYTVSGTETESEPELETGTTTEVPRVFSTFGDEGFVSEEGFGGGFSDFSDFSGSGSSSASKGSVPSSGDMSIKATATAWSRALGRVGKINPEPEELLQAFFAELNHRGRDYYEIPYEPAKYSAETNEELKNLIAQYLLLFSGDIDAWADDALEPRSARISVQLTDPSTLISDRIEKDIRRYVKAKFPAGYSVELSGVAFAASSVTKLITTSQLSSILFSIISVFIILSVYYRSLFAGLIGCVPLGIAVVINFGVMGFIGIKLNIATAMIASIAIGIGIDYTIHFMSSYRDARHKSDDLEAVTLSSLKTTGKAIVFNAISVGLGFAVLVLSQFNPLVYLGALIALTMGTSSLAALTILPVLLQIIKPRFLVRGAKKVQEVSV